MLRLPICPCSARKYPLTLCDRKTGVTLVDTGERDEYGMEPVDNLFSSPEKETAKRTNGASNDQSEGESDEEQSMELDDGMRSTTADLLLKHDAHRLT